MLYSAYWSAVSCVSPGGGVGWINGQGRMGSGCRLFNATLTALLTTPKNGWLIVGVLLHPLAAAPQAFETVSTTRGSGIDVYNIRSRFLAVRLTERRRRFRRRGRVAVIRRLAGLNLPLTGPVGSFLTGALPYTVLPLSSA